MFLLLCEFVKRCNYIFVVIFIGGIPSIHGLDIGELAPVWALRMLCGQPIQAKNGGLVLFAVPRFQPFLGNVRFHRAALAMALVQRLQV